MSMAPRSAGSVTACACADDAKAQASADTASNPKRDLQAIMVILRSEDT
jgi:hypothetical protein